MSEKNAGQPAADDKAGGEPVAWSSFHDTTVAKLRWVENVFSKIEPRYPFDYASHSRAMNDLANAIARLSSPAYTHPQPQAEVVSPDKAKNFYLAVCNFLVWIGREGTVHADDPIIDQLSNALHDIDGGVFKDSLKWPQAEVPDGWDDWEEKALTLGMDYAEAGLGMPQWEIFRDHIRSARAMLAAAPKPQEDLPAILKKQAS